MLQGSRSNGRAGQDGLQAAADNAERAAIRAGERLDRIESRLRARHFSPCDSKYFGDARDHFIFLANDAMVRRLRALEYGPLPQYVSFFYLDTKTAMRAAQFHCAAVRARRRTEQRPTELEFLAATFAEDYAVAAYEIAKKWEAEEDRRKFARRDRIDQERRWRLSRTAQQDFANDPPDAPTPAMVKAAEREQAERDRKAADKILPPLMAPKASPHD